MFFEESNLGFYLLRKMYFSTIMLKNQLKHLQGLNLFVFLLIVVYNSTIKGDKVL